MPNWVRNSDVVSEYDSLLLQERHRRAGRCRRDKRHRLYQSPGISRSLRFGRVSLPQGFSNLAIDVSELALIGGLQPPSVFVEELDSAEKRSALSFEHRVSAFQGGNPEVGFYAEQTTIEEIALRTRQFEFIGDRSDILIEICC